MPKTTSEILIYADDISIVTQARTLDAHESTLNEDMRKLESYFNEFSLNPNANKTVSS